MNKILLAIIGLLLSVGNIFASPSTSGGSGTPVLQHRLTPLAVPDLAPFGANIKITPVVAVPSISPGFSGMLANLFGDIESGRPLERLPLGVAPTSPSGYSVIDRQVYSAAAFATAETGAPMFAGKLNPESPLEKERGYTAGWVLEMSSADGTDSVSLSMARFSFTSSDLENSLGYTSQLWEKFYSQYARGYKANGDVVTAGDGDILVKKVVLFAWSRLYNGGGTEAGLNEIFGFVNSFSNFTLTFEVFLPNGQSAMRMVETNPQPGKLAISREGSRVTVTVIEGSRYILQTSTDMINWTDDTTVDVGSVSVFDDPDGQKYFRLL